MARLRTTIYPTLIPGCIAWWYSGLSSSIIASGTSVTQWNDLSGNNNHVEQSTAINQPQLVQRSQNRYTLGFQGNDALTISSFAAEPDPVAITVCAKVQPLTSTTGDKTVIAFDYSNNSGWLLWQRSGKFEWRLRGANNNDLYLLSSTTVSLGTWYFLAGTFIKTFSGQQTATFWFNTTVLTGSFPVNGSYYVDEVIGRPFFIGARTSAGNTPTDFYLGNIDQACWYNRVLTSGEINAIRIAMMAQ